MTDDEYYKSYQYNVLFFMSHLNKIKSKIITS